MSLLLDQFRQLQFPYNGLGDVCLHRLRHAWAQVQTKLPQGSPEKQVSRLQLDTGLPNPEWAPVFQTADADAYRRKARQLCFQWQLAEFYGYTCHALFWLTPDNTTELPDAVTLAYDHSKHDLSDEDTALLLKIGAGFMPFMLRRLAQQMPLPRLARYEKPATSVDEQPANQPAEEPVFTAEALWQTYDQLRDLHGAVYTTGSTVSLQKVLVPFCEELLVRLKKSNLGNGVDLRAYGFQDRTDSTQFSWDSHQLYFGEDPLSRRVVTFQLRVLLGAYRWLLTTTAAAK